MNNVEKLEMWMSARGTRNPVLEVVRDHFDEPWGTATEAYFQICFTLVRHGAEVPAAWEFRPGAWTPTMDENDPDNEDSDTGSLMGYEFDLIMRGGGYSNLIHAGNVLCRYLSILKMAGMDY